MTVEVSTLPEVRRRIPLVVWIVAVVFAGLSVWAASVSEGFLEADACTHYLSARFGFAQPHRLVSVWDRPLFMLVYTPAAALGGVMGARLVSLGLALGCAALAWRIAAKVGVRRAELAFVFTLGSPLVFLHSIAEMTELLFAVVMGLAVLAYMNRRWGWLALLLAMAPLGRPEGFGLLALGVAAHAVHRRWWWIAVLPMGLVTWSLTGWLLWGRPDYGYGAADFLAWLPRAWPWSGSSAYEAGPLLLWKQMGGGAAGSFLIRLPALTGPLVFPLVLAGTVLMARRRRDSLVVVLLPWGVLAGHSFLWWRGWMASNGELRYLLVTMPLWGVLAAAGWEWVCGSWAIRRPALWAGVLVALPMAANMRFHAVPLNLYEDDYLAREVAEWYRGDETLRREYPRLAASYIAVYRYLDISSTDLSKTVLWSKGMVQKRPVGVVLVWDKVNGTMNADARMCVSLEEIEAAGWRHLREFQWGERLWEVYVSEPVGD